MIADGAFDVGASTFAFLEAINCPYLRPNREPCWNTENGSPWYECPVCDGKGVIYAPPKYLKGFFVDTPDMFNRTKEGGVMKGEKNIIFKINDQIKPSMLKEQGDENAPRRIMRDKLYLLGRCCNKYGEREVLESMYVMGSPSYANVSNGLLYGIVKVVSNY